uniref:Fe2OG dioxygenase domain-containing protein n=1 Tax=Vannella robusta TaxID=1487602 RepID=A0A6U1X516_9EUKA|mmetsp:Transcript_6555/g.8099  ORF Transcript_6555/g.8099 Transcript_6555/m.8099 type:complete len:315 (+) Transcript_6555:20-964(+)
MAHKRSIPVVSIPDFDAGDASSREKFIQDLGSAFHDIGFVGVVNHGVSPALIKSFYAASKEFFALPTETKQKYEFKESGGQKGYTSFGTEHAKQSEHADLKEFFQIGRETEEMTTDERNPRVQEVPTFVDLGIELYRAFEKAGGILLKAIAIHLGLGEDYFTDKIENGISILRAIHYPPITTEPKSAIRAEQHEDINLITLLVGASAGGLQLLDANGEWQDVTPENDEIVINVGDMLQRLTNNYLKSTTHRVVNPPREEWDQPRLSIPFFLHPKPQTSLDVLDCCITDENPKQYPPIKAIEFLHQRLREIGLMK